MIFNGEEGVARSHGLVNYHESFLVSLEAIEIVINGMGFPPALKREARPKRGVE